MNEIFKKELRVFNEFRMEFIVASLIGNAYFIIHLCRR